MSKNELILLAHLLGDGCVLPRQPIHYTSEDKLNLDAVEKAKQKNCLILKLVVLSKKLVSFISTFSIQARSW